MLINCSKCLISVNSIEINSEKYCKLMSFEVNTSYCFLLFYSLLFFLKPLLTCILKHITNIFYKHCFNKTNFNKLIFELLPFFIRPSVAKFECFFLPSFKVRLPLLYVTSSAWNSTVHYHKCAVLGITFFLNWKCFEHKFILHFTPGKQLFSQK